MRETFGWKVAPISLADFLSNWVGDQSSWKNKLRWFGLGVICWALWKVHNKMATERKMVKSPGVIIFNILALMQQWKVLLKPRGTASRDGGW
jgi:hypothetical protein